MFPIPTKWSAVSLMNTAQKKTSQRSQCQELHVPGKNGKGAFISFASCILNIYHKINKAHTMTRWKEGYTKTDMFEFVWNIVQVKGLSTDYVPFKWVSKCWSFSIPQAPSNIPLTFSFTTNSESCLSKLMLPLLSIRTSLSKFPSSML